MYNTNFYRVHKRVCEGVNNIDEDSCKGKIDDGHIKISQPVGITQVEDEIHDIQNRLSREAHIYREKDANVIKQKKFLEGCAH